MKIREQSWFKKMNRKVNGKDVIKVIDGTNHIEGFEEAKELMLELEAVAKFQRRLDTRVLNWTADRMVCIGASLIGAAVRVRYLNTEIPDELRSIDPDTDEMNTLHRLIEGSDNIPEVYLDMRTPEYIKQENDKI